MVNHGHSSQWSWRASLNQQLNKANWPQTSQTSSEHGTHPCADLQLFQNQGHTTKLPIRLLSSSSTYLTTKGIRSLYSSFHRAASIASLSRRRVHARYRRVYGAQGEGEHVHVSGMDIMSSLDPNFLKVGKISVLRAKQKALHCMWHWGRTVRKTGMYH